MKVGFTEALNGTAATLKMCQGIGEIHLDAFVYRVQQTQIKKNNSLEGHG